MSRAILVDDTSSDDSDYYDNFNNMKAKIAKRQRKLQEIQQDKCDESQSTNNNELGANAITTENKIQVISDDDLMRVRNHTITLNEFGRCSPTGSIIIDSDSSSSDSKPLQIINGIDEIHEGQSTSSSLSKQQNENFPTNNTNTCTIRIHSNGNAKMFIHENDGTIKFLIEQFAERTNSDPKKIILVTRNTLKRCDPGETPRTLGFPEGIITELDAFENIEEEDIKMIRIKYQMKGKKAINAKILQDMPFYQLKELFCAQNNLNLANIKFVFDSTPLKDADTPLTVEMENEDTIDVYLV